MFPGWIQILMFFIVLVLPVGLVATAGGLTDKWLVKDHGKGTGLIQAVWHGDRPLGAIFWLGFFIPSAVFRIGTNYIENQHIVLIAFSVWVLLFVWIGMGIWRSASTYIFLCASVGGSRVKGFWGYVAQFIVAVNCLAVVFSTLAALLAVFVA